MALMRDRFFIFHSLVLSVQRRQFSRPPPWEGHKSAAEKAFEFPYERRVAGGTASSQPRSDLAENGLVSPAREVGTPIWDHARQEKTI